MLSNIFKIIQCTFKICKYLYTKLA